MRRLISTHCVIGGEDHPNKPLIFPGNHRREALEAKSDGTAWLQKYWNGQDECLWFSAEAERVAPWDDCTCVLFRRSFCLVTLAPNLLKFTLVMTAQQAIQRQ